MPSKRVRLTKHFRLDEWDCMDGTPVPERYHINVTHCAHNLQVLRDFLNKPIRITSGWRSKEHNRKVGGMRNSQHLVGLAADIRVFGYDPDILASRVEGLIRIGAMTQGGIGIYDDFLHVDFRGKKARWHG